MKFTIDPQKGIFNIDKDSFLKELETLDIAGYVYPHYYSTSDNILGYTACIIKVDSVDINKVKDIYNIEPNKIYSNNGVIHLVFDFIKTLNTFDYGRVTKALAFIYSGKAIDYHFYPHTGVITEHLNEVLDKELIEKCTDTYFLLDKEKEYQKIFTIKDYEEIKLVNKIPILDIIKTLYGEKSAPIEFGIDIEHNIHKIYGYGFDLVNNYFGSINKTKEFFNKNFDTNLEVGNDLDYTKSTTGVIITEGEHLFLNNFGYFTLDKSGQPKKLTDFYIKVHSKVINRDGKHSFIVSLINEKEGVETGKIIWENKTSAGLFADFIQAYGPYHYYGTTAFIKELHRQIATTKRVPEVRQIVGYGHHQKEGIILFKNGIWDIKQRLFTKKKNNDDDFYYNYNKNGYWVTDNHLNDLSTILTEGVPVLDTTGTVQFKPMLNLMNKLYADSSGTYLLLLALGMFGYLLYGDKDKPFPLIFTRGVTGSGKSMMNKILQRIWGIPKTGTDFENSTVFTMTITLSYLLKFPYFIAEYRENATMRFQKVGTLRSVFDKISQTKGRADQSVVKYNYSATPVLDGEELIKDPALRTRTLQYKLLKKHKIKGNFGKILREEGDILDNILFTYLTKSRGINYVKYLDEGFEIFRPNTTQDRIADNMANIYAGCMCFSNKHKDLYIKILIKITAEQENDAQENSNAMQIVKVMSRFIETTYKGVYCRKNDIVISWNILEDYVQRNRIETTLKIDSYKDHLLTLGYEIDFTEVEETLVEGVIIPYKNIKKQLLVNHEVYKGYKLYMNNG